MGKLQYFLQTKLLGLYINVLSYINPKKATHLAYRLFSEPRDGRLQKDKLPEFLCKCETETISFGNDYFQIYKWAGNENVILLAHGWESNASRWEKLLPYLRETGSTIVALDAPGHGLSSGNEFNLPRYAEYIDFVSKKYNPYAIIGHSLGGAATVYHQYKYRHPNLQKMVLLGAPSDFEILIGNYVRLLSLNSRMEKLLENYFMERFQFRPVDFSGKIFSEKFDFKGIIAHDPDDEVVAFIEAKKLSGSWKHAEFIETKGIGHSLHDDQLYKKILAFLLETSRHENDRIANAISTQEKS